MNMTVRQRNFNNFDVNFNNIIDRINRFNKQNRKRQNNYQQQFDVNDFSFFYFYLKQYEK